MKKMLVLLISLFSGLINAQNNTTCQTAIPFCLGPNYLYRLDTAGTAQICPTGLPYVCYGCMYYNRTYPTWFWVRVKTTGYLGFNVLSMDSISFNIDCWGPFQTRSNICDSITINNIADCSSSNQINNGLDIGNVTAGEYYLFCATNTTNHINRIYFEIGGTSTATTDCDLSSIEIEKNDQLKLHTSIPNPCSESSQIEFELNSNSIVDISIYSTSGTKIKTLTSGFQTSGKHKLQFNSMSISNGVYYIVLKTDNYFESQKLIILK